MNVSSGPFRGAYKGLRCPGAGLEGALFGKVAPAADEDDRGGGQAEDGPDGLALQGGAVDPAFAGDDEITGAGEADGFQDGLRAGDQFGKKFAAGKKNRAGPDLWGLHGARRERALLGQKTAGNKPIQTGVGIFYNLSLMINENMT